MITFRFRLLECSCWRCSDFDSAQRPRRAENIERDSKGQIRSVSNTGAFLWNKMGISVYSANWDDNPLWCFINILYDIICWVQVNWWERHIWDLRTRVKILLDCGIQVVGWDPA